MGAETVNSGGDRSTSSGRGRVLAYDGLRGFGLCLVVAHHAGYHHVVDGRVALDMFFTLSGFLITSILLREAGRSGAIKLGTFYIRRARRLLPALFLMIAGVVIAGNQIQRLDMFRESFDAIPYILLYVVNWYGIEEGVHTFRPFSHLWSLSVEEQFYLVWPLVVLVVGIKFRRARLLLPLCLLGSACALMARLHVEGNFTSFERRFTGTDVVADHLLLGCALAALLVHGGTAARTALLLWSRRLLPAALAVWTYAAFFELRELGPWTSTWRFPVTQSIIAVASTVVIAHLHFNEGSLLARVLSWRPATALGVMSYGFYLWHVPVFIAVRTIMENPSRIEVVLVGVPITLVLTTLSFHLVERPILEGRMPSIDSLWPPRWRLRRPPAVSLATAGGAFAAPGAVPPQADDATPEPGQLA